MFSSQHQTLAASIEDPSLDCIQGSRSTSAPSTSVHLVYAIITPCKAFLADKGYGHNTLEVHITYSAVSLLIPTVKLAP
uniref:ARAD1B19250p n=1 Tax=Blastobotrys adeninivorans TaxID=409370 RepID=A0A060TCX6_BLAAD